MYETFFGLHRSPFNGIPDSDGVYASSAFQDAYLALHRGVERAEGLILLTGESGTGKSTLLHQLQVALQAECFTVFAVNGTVGPEALVQTSRAVQELADRVDGVVEATPGLAEVATNDERRGVVVLLDDAHALPASALSGLADLFSRKRTSAPRVSVIAAAQPQFEQQLTDPRAQAIGHMLEQRVTLRSMDAAEVGPYMTCKLEAAGHRGEALFSADAVRCIAQHSDGIPKRVDILSGMALLIASEAGRRTADVFIVREALDDLEGNAEAPSATLSDTVQRAPRNGPIADWLNAALEALARGSKAVAVFTTDGARRLFGVCRRRLENLRRRGLRLFQTARGSSSSVTAKAPGGAHMDRDRLGLKVGFVGLVCIALLGVLFVALGGRSTSSDPAAGEIASATKTNADLQALRDHQEISALMQEKRRLESTLRATEENFRNSQDQVTEQLRKSQDQMTEQQNQIEKLRQQTAASEARLVALRARIPTIIVLPDDVLLTISSPTGEKFEVTPKDFDEQSVRTAFVRANLSPKMIESLRSLSSNAITQSSAQGENAASPSAPGDNPPAKPEIDLKEDTIAAIAQTKSDVAAGSVTEASFEVSKRAVPLQTAAASRVQNATIREAPKVVIPASESAGIMSPSVAIVTAENPVTAAGTSPSMPQKSNLMLVNEEPIIPREGGAAAIGPELQNSVRADATEELAVPALDTATVALAEDSSAAHLPPVEDRSTTSNASTAQLSVVEPGAGRESFDAQGESAARDLPSTSTLPSDIVYEVVAGDTLSGIARRFGFTVAQLREWNGLTGDRLNIAQQLRMQASPIASASVAPPAKPLKAPRVELSSLLLRAVQDNREAAVKALLDQGAPIEARDEEGNTPLILAASLGHWQVARLLVENGAKIDARGETGHTALSSAAWNGQHGVLSALLRRNAEVDAKTNDGWTPLMYASINGHTQCVRSLLEQGADVNARNRESRTALSAAVWNGHTEVARALLDKGAKVNAKTPDGWTPLLAAAWNGEVELVRLLLEYGADPQLSSGAGLTPAAAAEQRGHGDLASTLSGISAKAKSS